MRKSLFLAALMLLSSSILPAYAQTPIPAPRGWTTQTKTKGATTFTPPNLRAGEKYSITIYDAVPLGDQTLEAYLRKFAGPVGTGPGQLIVPLQIGTDMAQSASAVGTYAGPDGAQLIAAFNAFCFDGGRNVAVARTLTSGDAVFGRHKSSYEGLVGALAGRARAEAGEDLVRVPARVLERLQPGGAIVPGIYAGEQFSGDNSQGRLRLYLYPSGEFRFKNERDEDFGEGYNAPVSKGTVRYDPGTGRLSLSLSFDLENYSGSQANSNFSFYGRNKAGKPAIYGEIDGGFSTSRTSLVWVAPLGKDSSPSLIKAREAAIQAEKDRYKFVAAPGKGVSLAQIHAVVHRYEWEAYGDVIDEAALLLKDGTVHQGLPVAPDHLDVAASRRGEPKAWGKWRKKGQGYEVSWAGKPFEELKGKPTFPGAAQMRLEGRYAAVRATMYTHSFWGVTFDKTGRFSKDRRGGVSVGPGAGGVEGSVTATTTYDEGSVSSTSSVAGGASTAGGTVFSSSGKGKNPKGDRAGTYSINGYTLTLRYDNGRVARLPFFFTDATRKKVWFEGDTLELGLDG